MGKTNLRVLGYFPLLAVVIGSMVGSGIFNSPADLGNKANPGWIIAAWVITGIGFFSLVRVFQYLSDRRPELKGGIYTYAREAGGEFAGFNSAYGYWWSILFANLAYFFAIPKILSIYIPMLAHDKWASLIFASILLWGYYILIIAGIRTAGITNSIITVIKLMPLIFVIFVAIFKFKLSLMGDPFSMSLNTTGATVGFWRQIGGSFNVMVFAFLGIEAAVVMSGKAKRDRDISSVTLLGFVITLIIYMLISTLTMGVAPAKEIVNASSPLGAVLGYAIGDFGKHFLNFGFLFSVMGALLSWLLLAAETPFISSIQDGAFPKVFARINKRATPVIALAVSTIIMQIVLVLLYAFSASPDISAHENAPLLQNLYFGAISISVICSLVPYLFSSILSIRLALQEKMFRLIICAVVSFAFFISVFAAMAKYTALATIIYVTGVLFRLFVHRERKEKFPYGEIIFYAILFLASLVIIYFIAKSKIQF
jgi:arginine:ornithine antiporter / lysine permease